MKVPFQRDSMFCLQLKLNFSSTQFFFFFFFRGVGGREREWWQVVVSVDAIIRFEERPF